jgi:D-arabinose 1-dehydrogenase-like Zn-dependent alcohol dehydrogenase
MRIAVLREFKRPLSIEEIDPPKPDANEVLIAVEACGVCHSDLRVADRDWTQLARVVKKIVDSRVRDRRASRAERRCRLFGLDVSA